MSKHTAVAAGMWPTFDAVLRSFQAKDGGSGNRPKPIPVSRIHEAGWIGCFFWNNNPPFPATGCDARKPRVFDPGPSNSADGALGPGAGGPKTTRPPMPRQLAWRGAPSSPTSRGEPRGSGRLVVAPSPSLRRRGTWRKAVAASAEYHLNRGSASRNVKTGSRVPAGRARAYIRLRAAGAADRGAAALYHFCAPDMDDSWPFAFERPQIVRERPRSRIGIALLGADQIGLSGRNAVAWCPAGGASEKSLPG